MFNVSYVLKVNFFKWKMYNTCYKNNYISYNINYYEVYLIIPQFNLFWCLLKYVTVPELLHTGFLLWRPGFKPKADHVGLVICKVAQGQEFLQVPQFYSISDYSSVSCPIPPSTTGCHSRLIDVAASRWTISYHVHKYKAYDRQN
jgi:hypothetical protein